MNNQKQKEVRFPSGTHLIILKLLKEYNLEENEIDSFNKLKKGEKTFGGIVAKAVKSLSMNEMSFDDFLTILQNDLGLSKDKAKNLSEEIEKKVLNQVTKDPSIKTPNTQKNNTPKERDYKKTDSYRESI